MTQVRHYLGDEQRAEIRARYSAGGVSHRELATEFGCSEALVKVINRGVVRPDCFRGCGKPTGHADPCFRRESGWRLDVSKEYPHGTNARYVLNRCRCRPCTSAATNYERERNRAIAYGRWDCLVDAAPARAHLRRLSDAGVGYKRVALVCGVPSSTLARIMGSRTGSGRRWRLAKYRPIARIRASKLERICSVTVSEAMAPGARVTLEESAVARRRVDELIAHGMRRWQVAVTLDPRLQRFVAKGRRPGLQVIRHPHMTRRTCDAIARLYVSFFRERRMATPEEQRERSAA